MAEGINSWAWWLDKGYNYRVMNTGGSHYLEIFYGIKVIHHIALTTLQKGLSSKVMECFHIHYNILQRKSKWSKV